MITNVERVRVKAARVDPIKSIEDIERIRQYFISNYRHGRLYELLWTLGINTGLRAGDLLSLKVGNLRNPKWGVGGCRRGNGGGRGAKVRYMSYPRLL